MALEKREGLPYEILLRFNFGGAHQDTKNALGDFEGAHYIEGTAIIDSDTGAVVNYTPGPAQAVSTEQISKLLGNRFGEFEAQIKALYERIAGLEAGATESKTEIAKREEQIAERASHIASQDEQIAALRGKLATARKALAE